ncbi:hypothetical protein [Brevundimonas subvibrioides]|nr:hypothetical protein [Brevundimonas subvibrioides]
MFYALSPIIALVFVATLAPGTGIARWLEKTPRDRHRAQRQVDLKP